jgi:CheY-like chemotaxis protein
MAKVLIVDDDVDLVKSTSALLEANGHRALSAPDGATGLAKASSEKPDVILLDVAMATDIEGFEVARRLKADAATSRIPVILVTGIRKAKHLATKLAPDEAWLPVKAVLEKPVQPALLLKSIQDALAG